MKPLCWMLSPWWWLLFQTVVVFAQQQEQQDSSSSQQQQQQSIPIFGPQRNTSRLCDIYVAPSPDRGGWGVFAARDFEAGEVVEVAPRYVPLKTQQMMASNELHDFHYDFQFPRDPDDFSFGVAIFGMSMFYNHGVGDEQNVFYTSFGHEPDKNMPWASLAVGFVALRDIQRGQELLSSYGDEWFDERGMEMIQRQQEEEVIPGHGRLLQLEDRHCSRIVSGLGQSTWWNRVLASHELVHGPESLPKFNMEAMLPLQDHPTAVAKQFIREGYMIDKGPALVVPVADFEHSPLSPMLIRWTDLTNPQTHDILSLREMYYAYKLKGKKNSTDDEETENTTTIRQDQLHHDVLEFFDESAILPASGHIGLVLRVGPDEEHQRFGENFNCRMEIDPQIRDLKQMDHNSAGIVLKLYATKDIHPGQELRLHLPDTSSWHAKMSLMQHLALTGQPIPPHIVNPYNPDTAFAATTGGNDEEEQEL
ncbi:expressed unknown protein [Seminavis robusta]|uniref:SET domain-containing protein n=1 Tax=Seminavis robusta TaxID=568900 RepID=A0A9N8EQ70_9STRA|nr:expressed unknown protein [Seminavis robusta]|eukprot:Sro1536_g280620.1 n/a (478) ;mRNA; r:16302-17735